MLKLKYLFTFVAVTGLLVGAPTAQAADIKVGVVVTQNLLAGSAAGQEAFEKLKGHKEQAQEKLDKRASELKEMEADLQKRAMVLSDEEKKKAAEDFDMRQREAARLKEDLERDLKRQEAEAMAVVNRFLSQIIVAFGQESEYDLVLDAQAAVYFSEKMDITEALVKRANEEWGK
jgi:outer membrane protein